MAQQVMREAQALKPIQPPSFLNHHQGIDGTLSSGMSAAKRCMEMVLDKANAIIARRALADPRMTYGGNLFEIEQLADKFDDFYKRQFASAAQHLAKSLRDAEAKLKATVGVEPTASARALQDRLSAMPPKKRVEALTAAFANGDKELLGAVVDQHALLHGCDTEMVNELFDAYQQRVAPKEYDAVAAHHQAKGWLEKGELFAAQFTARAYSQTEVAAEKRRAIAAVLSSYGMGIDDPAPHGAGFSGEPTQGGI